MTATSCEASGRAAADCLTAAQPTLDKAIRRLLIELTEGLRHGFFEYTVSCEVVGHERRQLVLHAGKSYRFLIPKDECVPTQDTMTPAMGASESNDQPLRIVEMTSQRQASEGVNAGCESMVADDIGM